MQCPLCQSSGDVVKARASIHGEEYNYYRTCKKEVIASNPLTELLKKSFAKFKIRHHYDSLKKDFLTNLATANHQEICKKMGVDDDFVFSNSGLVAHWLTTETIKIDLESHFGIQQDHPKRKLLWKTAINFSKAKTGEPSYKDPSFYSRVVMTYQELLELVK